MIKSFNLFKKEKINKKIIEKSIKLTNPDLYTHRKSPLESFKSIKLAEDAIKDTQEMIDEFGPRLSGSEQCLNCSNKIKEKLNEFCDYTEEQSFFHKGSAHTLWLKLLPFIYVTTLILLLSGFSFIPLIVNAVFLFYVYKEFLTFDSIFEKYIKKEEGNNIFGVIAPEDEVRKTIIFSSHHDSAKIPNINRGDQGYFINVELPLILFSLSVIINIVELFVEIFTRRLFNIGFPQLSVMIILLLLLIASPIVFKIRKFYSNKVSPGAGDNLISSNILIQLSRYFNWAKVNKKGLKNTRIIFTSFDAEELGLRGSKAWFKDNKKLLINATQLNFDCIYKSKDLIFIDSDKNGLFSLSKDLAYKCVKLATDMGFKAKSIPLPLLSGATDAASGFSAGIEACSLLSVDLEKRVNNTFYHTEEDTVDKIEKAAVEQAIAIAIKLANLIDNKTDNDDFIQTDDKDEKEKDLCDLINFKKIARR